jgi:hypothetical protein
MVHLCRSHHSTKVRLVVTLKKKKNRLSRDTGVGLNPLNENHGTADRSHHASVRIARAIHPVDNRMHASRRPRNEPPPLPQQVPDGHSSTHRLRLQHHPTTIVHFFLIFQIHFSRNLLVRFPSHNVHDCSADRCRHEHVLIPRAIHSGVNVCMPLERFAKNLRLPSRSLAIATPVRSGPFGVWVIQFSLCSFDCCRQPRMLTTRIFFKCAFCCCCDVL